MQKQKEISLGNTTWSEMGKQNVQTKEVYWKIALIDYLFLYLPNLFFSMQ